MTAFVSKFLDARYQADIAKHYKPLSHEKERELIALAKKGDKRATDRIVCSQLLWIIKDAKRFFRYNGTSVDDLFNAAIIGVYVAIEKFDESQGLLFTTFSRWWIRAELTKFVQSDDLVRLPANVINALRKQKKDIDKGVLKKEDAELTEFTTFSLDNVLKENDGPESNKKTYAELIGEEDTTLADKEFSAYISSVLDLLETDIEKRTLILFFGLNNEEKHTEEEIGVILGVTKQRVSQIKIKAIDFLRKKLKRSELVERSYLA